MDATVEGDAELSGGETRYRIDGPADGEPCLLLHGATVPAWEFDRLVPLLAEAGFRCVRFDLYGHGASARPRVDDVHDLFVNQAAELLDALEIAEPVNVLGHSLGAAIGARLAIARPDRVRRLLLAAPLVDFRRDRAMLRALSVPLFGELLVESLVLPLLVRRRTRRYREIEDGRFALKFREQLAKPGFGRALLSLVRSGSLDDQLAVYERLGRTATPVRVLRGGDDVIVSAAQTEELLARVPGADLDEIPGAAHAFHLTDPERVARAVLAFFGARA